MYNPIELRKYAAETEKSILNQIEDELVTIAKQYGGYSYSFKITKYYDKINEIAKFANIIRNYFSELGFRVEVNGESTSCCILIDWNYK